MGCDFEFVCCGVTVMMVPCEHAGHITIVEQEVRGPSVGAVLLAGLEYGVCGGHVTVVGVC